MASYYLNDEGHKALQRAIELYPDQFSSWTQKIADISKRSGVPLRTIYRIMHKEQDKFAPIPVKLISINLLFQFLLDDNTFDVSDRGFISFKDEIVFSSVQRSELRLIADCENLHFGSNATSQLDFLERCFNRNPNGFWIFKNNRKVVISVVFIPISDVGNAKELFMRGDYAEGDVKAKHLYSIEDKAKVDSLYIESLTMHDTSLKRRIQSLKLLCNNLKEILENSCYLNNLKYVYALAASPMGENLMLNAGFELCPDQVEPRKDGRKMYFITADNLIALVRVREGRIERALQRRWP